MHDRYSRPRSRSVSAGSSVLRVVSSPASRIRRNGCSSSRGTALAITTLEFGQTVSGIRSPASRAVSSGSSMLDSPWSMRSDPSTSSPAQMWLGGVSSPWCEVRRSLALPANSKASAKSVGSIPSSVESSPTPMTRSTPGLAASRSSTSRRTMARPAAAPYARSMSAISIARALVSASAASSPSARPATMSARSCPASRCRAGVKNVSRYTSPWAAPSTMLSYASRAQSSRLPRVDCTSQKISRKVSRFEYRYSSVGSEVGSSIPFLRASSTTVSGRIVPSTWQCSSTFGSRSSAVTTSTVPPSSEWVPQTLTGAAALVYLAAQGADERQVPVSLGVVEPVSDHEHAGDVEGLVLHRHLDPQLVRLAEQHAHLERGRPPRPQRRQQVVEGQPGVHDVLDQHHVPALDLVVEILEQPHHPGGLGRRPVRRGRDEVHLMRDGQGPRQVGHQHHGPLEHPHQQQVEPPVVLGDPRRQLGDPLPDALLVQQHRLDLLECHRHAPHPVATRPWAARLPAPPA